MKHLLALNSCTSEWIDSCLDLAAEVKTDSRAFHDGLHRQTLFMIFEKPSLRTRVSFEVGMHQLGGQAIFYDLSSSPLGAGKESLSDTVRTVSRYGDLIMARVFEHGMLEEMAAFSDVPVINGLSDYTHPCQILADLLTIRERKGALSGLTLAYLGDSRNNVTHSLLFGCAAMGMNVRIGCPEGEGYAPLASVVTEAAARAASLGAEVSVVHDAAEAVRGADVVYTDSWMSYHIPKEEQEQRVKDLMPFQVNEACMQQAKPDAIFMNCLPAARGYEQTAEVIDGPQSVVFDEAENRLHAQKAIMMKLREAWA